MTNLDTLAQDMAAAYNDPPEIVVEKIKQTIAKFDWKPILFMYQQGYVWFGILDLYHAAARLTGRPPQLPTSDDSG